MGFKNVVNGIIAFLISFSLTVASWYVITPMIDSIPDDFFKILVWIGIIIMVVVANVLVPWFMMSSNTVASVRTITQAGIEFFIAYVATVIAAYMMPLLINSFDGIDGTPDFSVLKGIFWAGTILALFIADVIVPPFIALGGFKLVEESLEGKI